MEQDQHRKPSRAAKEKESSLSGARQRATDLIAMRDHSEAELRTKLARHFTTSEIGDAIEYAHKQNWILPENELVERVATSLSQKNKGYEYICQYLHSKGLPSLPRDPGEELRKARRVIDSKLAKGASLDYEGKKKLQRFLAGRGFESETIREVLDLTDDDGSF